MCGWMSEEIQDTAFGQNFGGKAEIKSRDDDPQEPFIEDVQKGNIYEEMGSSS